VKNPMISRTRDLPACSTAPQPARLRCDLLPQRLGIEDVQEGGLLEAHFVQKTHHIFIP
jgi:hypothetical protein